MGSEHPHAVEVVDLNTGAIRYIRSGSKIAFIEGQITDLRTQGAYNKATKNMPDNEQNKPNGKNAKEIANRSSAPKLRAYKCEFCDYWHLTHKKNKMSFH